MKRITTKNAEETEQLGEKIGRQLHGGEVIELISDLGGGKTTFVHGLARGIGSQDRVASPTFTISRVYKGDRFNLYHFDFYRLSDAGLMEHEMHELVEDPEDTVVVEWGGVVAHVLPKDRLAVEFKSTGDDSRELIMTYPKSLGYLVEDMS